MIDLDNIDAKNIDNDSLLDIVEKIGSIYVEIMIEATLRSNTMEFSDEQTKRMMNFIINQNCRAYDTLGISENQMAEGINKIKDIIFDPER